MIKRTIREHITQRIHQNRAIVVIGARRVMKRTLISEILASKPSGEVLHLIGDNPVHQNLLYKVSLEQIKTIAGLSKIIFY